jgi:hypothetical protein
MELLKLHPLVKANSHAYESGADGTRQLFWRTIEKEYPKLASDESGWLFMELFDKLLGSGARRQYLCANNSKTTTMFDDQSAYEPLLIQLGLKIRLPAIL